MSLIPPYVCDTIPPARLATSALLSDPGPALIFDQPAMFTDNEHQDNGSPPPSQGPPPRKLCVRHQRMADEGTNLKLQQSLDALPVEEREAVNAVWSKFSSSSHPRRALILQGLLTMCCFSQLSLLTDQLAHLIRIDPFAILPREVGIKILGYLDATSLCRAAQVARRWKCLADDDILWRGICEQHIGQTCRKCGWGLPILEKKTENLSLPLSSFIFFLLIDFDSETRPRRFFRSPFSAHEAPVLRNRLVISGAFRSFLFSHAT